MNRRKFLHRAVSVGTLPIVLQGMSVTAYGRTPLLERLTALATETDRVLVLVQLNGGNDGLNMVIPIDQYSALAAARSNIMIPEASVLKLTNITGLHPGMTGLFSLYNEGKVAVVQSVGYANPNQSHFRATDIWLTGSDSNQVLTSGWLGRYLDEEYPGFPIGYPTAGMPDPLAIQIGSVVSPALQGSTVNLGMAITNPNATFLSPGGADTAPDTPAGHELTYIRQVAEQTQLYATVVRTAASKGSNKSTLYPAGTSNGLANQLKIVAQLVSGGLKTRVYVVNLGGFDTHSGQVVAGATDTGTHATLLSRLSVAITAFMDDVKLLGIDRRVVGMTFSEFGRRIKSNASTGTDHGTAAPLFMFGSEVQGGVVGANPALPAAATSSNNIAMQYDYRMIYATLIRDWFGASAAEAQSILPNHTVTLPLIKSSAVLAVGDQPEAPSAFALMQNYPNPFNPSTTVKYELPRGSQVALEVYTSAGELVRTLVQGDQPAGAYTVTFDATGLASGMYFCRLRAGEFTATRRMAYIR